MPIDDDLRKLSVDKKKIKKYVDPENYVPTKSEIAKEIGNNFVDSVKNLKFKNSILEEAVAIMALINIFPYSIASAIRYFKEPVSEEEKNRIYTKTDHVITVSSILAGVCGVGMQVFGYYQLARHGKEEFLLLPVATNVISGIYEIGRYQVNNAKRRLINRHKGSLDDKI